MMRVFAAAVASNTPVLLWGNPGQGKSAKIESYAKAWGRHCETVVGSVREATDYLGLPLEVNGEVVYSPPAWAKRLNAAPKSLLFMDELTTASPSVGKAMLRIFQERFCGDYELADTVSIVAAANPPETAADGWELAPPVANRLLHLDWHFDVEEWLMGVGNDFATSTTHPVDALCVENPTDSDRAAAYSLITGFLRHRPDLLAPNPPEDLEAAGRAWASPRSWTNALNMLAHLNPRDDDAILLAMKGLVGEGPAIEFFGWRADANLPHPDAVLSDPTIIDWTLRPDILFAVARSVAHVATSRGDKDTYSQAIAVMEAFADNAKTDIALPSVRELLTTMPDGVEWTKDVRGKFTELFEKSGMLAAA